MARRFRPSRAPSAGAAERSGICARLSSAVAPLGAGAADGAAAGAGAARARLAIKARTNVSHSENPRKITCNSTLLEFGAKADESGELGVPGLAAFDGDGDGPVRVPGALSLESTRHGEDQIVRAPAGNDL